MPRAQVQKQVTKSKTAKAKPRAKTKSAAAKKPSQLPKKTLAKAQAMAVPTSSGALVAPGSGVKGFITTFTKAKGDEIIEQVREGMPVSFACHFAHVPAPTGYGWLQKGEEDPTSIYAEFAAEVRAAQAQFVREAIDGIKDAGLSDAKQWAALMTLLERIYPETFKRPDGKTQNINVNVGVGFVEKRLHELHAAGEIVYDGS